MTTPQRDERQSILFVGTGEAAGLHSRTLRRHFPGVGRAYVSRSADRAHASARLYGGRACTDGWNAALADGSLTTVFLTTPPDTHAGLTLEALDAGKHVIVEKPAFLDMDEFRQVEEAADRVGRQVLVAENYFYKPVLRRLRSVLASGLLGQVRLVEINAVKRQRADGWRGDPARSGGGALFEGGVHWVSFMASLGLDIESVRGFFPGSPPGHERSAVFVAEYAQGATGVLTYSWEIPSTLRGLRLSRVWGTGGSVLFESNGLFLLRTGGRPRLFLPGIADIQGYRAMMADFLRALSSGEPPLFTLRDARRDVALVQAAYASATRPSHTARRIR